MKSKLLFIFINVISLFLFSCSGDDENANNQGPEVKKLVSEVEIIYSENSIDYIELTYFPDNTIETMNLDGDLFVFDYTEGRITSIQRRIDGELEEETQFGYSPDGRLASVTKEGVSYEINFNETNNCYSYAEEDGEGLEVCLNDWGDIANLTFIYDPGSDLISYEYETEKFGSLASTQPFMLYFILANSFAEYYQIISFLTRKPVNKIHADFSEYENENSFDEDNYLIKTTSLNDDFDTTIINYTYTEL